MVASIATDDLSSLETCNIRRGLHDHRRLGTRADSVFRPKEIEGTKSLSSLFLSLSWGALLPSSRPMASGDWGKPSWKSPSYNLRRVLPQDKLPQDKLSGQPTLD